MYGKCPFRWVNYISKSRAILVKPFKLLWNKKNSELNSHAWHDTKDNKNDEQLKFLILFGRIKLSSYLIFRIP